MKRRFLGFIGVFILIFGIINVSANAITQSEFDSKISGLKSEFPHGKAWTGSFDGGIQCYGYAHMIANRVFGSYAKNWTKSYNLNSVKAGDVVQYGNTSGQGHTIFVTSVSGDTITYTDCNSDNPSCTVKWNQTVSKSSNKYWIYSFSYICSAPAIDSGNDPFGHVDSVSGGAGTISLSGWAVDNDTPNTPIEVKVYVGGGLGSGAPGYSLGKASINRPGLGWGDNHGFNTTIAVAPRGQQTIYVYAMNVGGGRPYVEIGKRTVTITEPPSPGKPTLNLNGVPPFATGDTVNFSWGVTSDTVCYDLKIYDWEKPANLIKQIQGIQSTSYGINLPRGNYSAVLFSKNTYAGTESNWIAFQILDRTSTPGITTSDAADGKNITITCSTPGAAIYYTLDGSNPTTSSSKYTAPFKLTKTITVKAIAAASGYTNSATASKTIEVATKPVSTNLKTTSTAVTNSGFHTTTIKIDNPCDAILLEAIYDSKGKMLDMEKQKINSASRQITVKIPSNSNSAYAKIFVWTSENSMKPLCKAEEIKLK